MTAELVYARAVGLQHLRDQQSQLSVAQDGHGIAFGNIHLVQNFARSRKRLQKHGVAGSNPRWNDMQIPLRQRQEFAECPRVFYDAQYLALRTMAAQAARAPFALCTGDVDFPDYSLADEVAVVRPGHFTNELVARNACKTVVAALEFQIGVADSAYQQTNDGEAFKAARLRNLTN